MTKSPDAFRSIGEVSRLVGVAPHVLRYWESQFTQLAPVKRGDGRRYYRPDDVRLVAGLCQVLREEGLSIRGAKLLIAADRGAGLREIGAARLNEPSEAGTMPAQSPAARMTVPPPLEPPPATTRPPESAPVSAPPHHGAAPVWLGRLAATAAALRRHELSDKPLPAQAQSLFHALRGAARA